MKTRNLLVFLFASIMTCVFFSSCGSTWEISGNNVVINKAESDTVIPAGTYYFIPDSI